MYKEYAKNNIIFAIFCNKKLYYQFTSTKVLTEIIPRDCIHILTNLPFNRNIDIMLNMWRILIQEKLTINNS